MLVRMRRAVIVIHWVRRTSGGVVGAEIVVGRTWRSFLSLSRPGVVHSCIREITIWKGSLMRCRIGWSFHWVPLLMRLLVHFRYRLSLYLVPLSLLDW